LQRAEEHAPKFILGVHNRISIRDLGLVRRSAVHRLHHPRQCDDMVARKRCESERKEESWSRAKERGRAGQLQLVDVVAESYRCREDHGQEVLVPHPLGWVLN
jgi:hypothetical protein